MLITAERRVEETVEMPLREWLAKHPPASGWKITNIGDYETLPVPCWKCGSPILFTYNENKEQEIVIRNGHYEVEHADCEKGLFKQLLKAEMSTDLEMPSCYSCDKTEGSKNP